jgi:hypothetical protein
MQCLSCGGEMRLIAVADDQQLVLPGYLPHTFQCTACNEPETRLLFTRERPVPVAPAREVQPVQQPIRMSAWEQAIAKLRNHQVVISGQAKVRKAAERASDFNRQWDDALPRSQSSSPLRRRTGGDTLWARAVARLRPVPGSER